MNTLCKNTILKPPSDFSFPFPPYDIQEEFMTKLYHVLENGQCGIFESPTGTVSYSDFLLSSFLQYIILVEISYYFIVG